jgi:regulation of enolase protein 1 (concanavalin A-like superfamily)
VDERNWGKLCFEFSPDSEPMLVSVVTRQGISDDANSFTIPDRSVWLRVSRLDRVYAYHASVDGVRWQLMRVFTLSESVTDHQLGFEGQSPTGEGCTVVFDRIAFSSQRLHELRNGS